MPGVLLSEHAFQCAALLVADSLGAIGTEEGAPVLTKIEGARFKRVVAPGETVSTFARVRERLGPAWYFSADTRCEGARVLSIRFVLSSTEEMARVAEKLG